MNPPPTDTHKFRQRQHLFSLPICVIMIRVMKMDNKKELPKRKHPRLDHYDYSTAGAYFVTICTQNRRCILSRPTIMDAICAYKSLTTRECKKVGKAEKLFQTSFYEHVIRGREDYEEIVKYIHENPMRWYYDELYAEE